MVLVHQEIFDYRFKVDIDRVPFITVALFVRKFAYLLIWFYCRFTWPKKKIGRSRCRNYYCGAILIYLVFFSNLLLWAAKKAELKDRHTQIARICHSFEVWPVLHEKEINGVWDVNAYRPNCFILYRFWWFVCCCSPVRSNNWLSIIQIL